MWSKMGVPLDNFVLIHLLNAQWSLVIVTCRSGGNGTNLYRFLFSLSEKLLAPPMCLP